MLIFIISIVNLFIHIISIYAFSLQNILYKYIHTYIPRYMYNTYLMTKCLNLCVIALFFRNL